jgi:outer membrane protein assembly factor BamB
MEQQEVRTMTAERKRRGGSWLVPGIIVLLLLLFSGLVVYQKFFAHASRYAAEPALLAELADAVFVPDPSVPPDPAFPWPCWRGPHGNGVAHEPNLLTQWPPRGPTRLWQARAEDGYSSFAVGGGKVVTLLTAEDGKETVVCWTADDKGKELWRYPYQPSASSDYGGYGGSRSTPTLEGDRVYAVGSAGLLLCLKADTGKKIWEYDLRQELNAPGPRWGHAFSPLIVGNQLFTCPGRQGIATLAAFDKRDGTLLWNTGKDPASYASPIALTVGDTTQIVFFLGKKLVGVSPRDGAQLWEFPWKTEHEVNAATPLAIKARKGDQELNYVFISSGYSKGSALVKIASEKDGKFSARRVWETNELCSHFASPVRHGDYLYGLDENRDLTCLDLRTGALRWRWSKPEESLPSGRNTKGYTKGSLLCVGDLLLVLGQTGELALVEANPDKYVERALARPFPRHTKCWTVPVLAGGRLYLRDQRRILCLDVLRK